MTPQLFHTVKITVKTRGNLTAAYSGFSAGRNAAFGGRKTGFGFVADRKVANEVDIRETICVG